MGTIYLDCWDGARDGYVKLSNDAENPTSFWFVLPPTTFEGGITVTVHDTNGNTYTKSTDNAIAIERNIVQPMAALALTDADDNTGGEDDFEPIVGELVTITALAYDGYEATIDIPEEVTERGNALRYESMSLPMYNFRREQGTIEIDMLLYNSMKCAETSGVYTILGDGTNGAETITPGQPNVLIIGEYAYSDDPNEMVVYVDGTTEVVSVDPSDSNYYDYIMNAVWMYPEGWESGYYRPMYDWTTWLSELDTDVYDSEKYWTGAYERVIVEAKKPEPFDGGVDISAYGLTPTNGVILFEPTENVVFFTMTIMEESDYQNIMLPLLDNNEDYVPWFVTSEFALMNFGTQMIAGNEPFEIALDDWFVDTTVLQGKEICVLCTSSGDNEGRTQMFNTFTFTMPEVSEPAPEPIVIDNVEHNAVSFTVNHTGDYYLYLVEEALLSMYGQTVDEYIAQNGTGVALVKANGTQSFDWHDGDITELNMTIDIASDRDYILAVAEFIDGALVDGSIHTIHFTTLPTPASSSEVVVELSDVTSNSVYITATPAASVAQYYIYVRDRSWADGIISGYGESMLQNLVKNPNAGAWNHTEAYEGIWEGLSPNTEYYLMVLAIDGDGAENFKYTLFTTAS